MKKFIKNKRIIKLFIVLLICILTITLTSCGANSKEMSDNASFDSPQSGDTISDSIKDNRKVYFKVSYNFRSNDIDTDLKRINQIRTKYEGYIESSNLDKYNNKTIATYVLRIPTAKLDNFMAEIEDGASIQHKSINSYEVTNEYVTLEAQIQTLTASRAQYQAMLETGSLTITQITQINDKINEIDYKLNALNIQKTQYDNLIEYSTVTVKFNQDVDNTEKNTMFSNYGPFLLGFVKAILAIIMYSLPFLALGCIITLSIVLPLRAKKKKRMQKAQEYNEQHNL